MVTDGNKIFEERRKADRRSNEKNVPEDRRKKDRRVKDINGVPRKRKINKI